MSCSIDYNTDTFISSLPKPQNHRILDFMSVTADLGQFNHIAHPLWLTPSTSRNTKVHLWGGLLVKSVMYHAAKCLQIRWSWLSSCRCSWLVKHNTTNSSFMLQIKQTKCLLDYKRGRVQEGKKELVSPLLWSVLDTATENLWLCWICLLCFNWVVLCLVPWWYTTVFPILKFFSVNSVILLVYYY